MILVHPSGLVPTAERASPRAVGIPLSLRSTEKSRLRWVQPRAGFARDLGDTCRRRGIGADRRPVLAKHAGLLAPDGFARVAQPLDVVDADGGDHGGIGVDGIDGVEPPAEADFQHRHVNASTRELVERRERAELEVGQRDPRRAPIRGAPNAAHSAASRGIHAVHAHARSLYLIRCGEV